MLNPATSLVPCSIDSEIDHLEGECLEEINELWEKYTEGPAVEGCDEACLRECYQILQDAVWGTKNKNCPLQSEIQRCFHVSNMCREAVGGLHSDVSFGAVASLCVVPRSLPRLPCQVLFKAVGFEFVREAQGSCPAPLTYASRTLLGAGLFR